MDRTFRALLESQTSDQAAWLKERIHKIESLIEARRDYNDSDEKLKLLKDGLIDELKADLAERRVADRLEGEAQLRDYEAKWKKEHAPRDPAAALLEYQQMLARYASMTPAELRNAYEKYQYDQDLHLEPAEIDALRAAYLRAWPAPPPSPGSDKIPDSYRVAVSQKMDDRPWMRDPAAQALEDRMLHENRLPAGAVLLEAEGEAVVSEGAPAPEGPGTAFIGVKLSDLI